MKPLRWLDDRRPGPPGGIRYYCPVCPWEADFPAGAPLDTIGAAVEAHVAAARHTVLVSTSTGKLVGLA